ncbi:DUF2510 domain-containing protein [Arthrobacter pityocampae]|uniref:DUF2510 domain-containing protein n=1 Tax=Arthrobacter pityocampae TaxID=547334 RepID=UPI003734E6FE
MNMAAGWYQDAHNAAVLRWWDGNQWTEHTQPVRPQQVPSARKNVAVIASIFIGFGLIAAFIPVLSFFSWAFLLVGVICAIIALAKKQKLKGLSIAGLCVAPIAFIVAIIVSLATLSSFGDPSASVPITAGPVVPDEYETPEERDLALLVKDADPHTGEKLALHGVITQFDTATGDCMFRANAGREQGDQAWDYDHNVVFTAGAVDCTELSEFVEDDTIRVLATVAGTQKYSGMFSQDISVPLMQVDEIELIEE